MIKVIHNLSENYGFPCLPNAMGYDPLAAYLQRLKIGFVFAYTNDSPKLIILEVVRINYEAILIMCEREGNTCEMEGFHPWSIFEIKYINDSLTHTKIGAYFEKDEANEEWNNFINKFDRN